MQTGFVARQAYPILENNCNKKHQLKIFLYDIGNNSSGRESLKWSISIIFGFHVCKFTYLMTFMCKLQINTPWSSAVIYRDMHRGTEF